MKMWLRQATLAVLTVATAAMAISSQTSVFLNNKEERVEVPAGSTLILHCCLDTKSRSWITWYFQPTGKSRNSTQIFKKMINKSASTFLDDCKDSEKTYSIMHVNKTDSGLYYCNVTVDIPLPSNNGSKSKEVVIMKSVVENTTPLVMNEPVTSFDSTVQFEWWMWVLVGVSAFVLLVLVVVCILLRRCANRNREADPIYANTHSKIKGSSPRPEMNHLKTVSSSQNLRTPSPGQRYGEGKRRPRQ